jgi:uncharacterized protein
MFAVRRALTRPFQAAAGTAPFGAKAIHFASESGAEIHGWWWDVPDAKGIVLLLPGVRANRRSMVDRATFLHTAGYTTLLIDFQGIGESRGKAITFGELERYDVLAAVAFARTQAPHRKLAIIGSSLGGAATLLATPPLAVDAMVLEAVYPSIDRAVENRLAIRMGRTLAKIGSPLLLAQVDEDALRPIDHIANVRCPLLIIAGANDEHTTAADTRALFAAARAPKELWLVPGKKHVDLHRAMTREYEVRVLRFLQTSLTVSATASVAKRPIAAWKTSSTEMSSMQR